MVGKMVSESACVS